MTPLTERSGLELARSIRRGTVSATEVVRAHIEQHRRWEPRINALVAERYEAAIREAAAADERVAALPPERVATTRAGAAAAEVAAAGSPDAKRAVPPLLGVPFTVKESIALAGMPQSSGLVARREYRSSETATAVQRLIEAGAIPLGMTNTSELTLWIESTNRVYGRTSNPYDRRRTVGGSSGGEGAAVGVGGSPFGVASDIAGSIRIPALFCGVFGHKPSSGLVPNTGCYPPAPGAAGRMLGTGQIARRAEDLMPLLKIMAGPDGRDPLARTATLGNPGSVSLEGLPVATVENSALLPMSREVRDARERAVGALAAAGAVVRRVAFRSWRRAVLPYLATLQAGASQTTIELLAAAGAPAPSWRTLLSRGGPHTAPTRLALAFERLPPLEGPRLERLLDAGRALGSELADVIGDGVLLHPAHPRVAPRHGRTLGRAWLMTPAAMFNLAGVPVTEVPLGLSEHGLPLGVQVAAGLDRDHVSIAVALELERVFGGWVPPAGGGG